MPLVPVPIFNGDVATSVFGVMRFPDDLNKAHLYASWRLAKVTQSNDAALLRRVAKEAAEFSPYYFDVGKAEAAGGAVGAIMSTMVRLIHHHPKIATWERAIVVVRNNDGGLPSGRPLLQAYRRQMNKVAHFWAAFHDRGIKFGDVQAFGDGQEFAVRAEIIRQVIRDFEIARATTKTEETIRSEYEAAFHVVGIPDGVRALINISAIPRALLKEPTAKKRGNKTVRKNSDVVTTPITA
jgi:hypothetical protein